MARTSHRHKLKISKSGETSLYTVTCDSYEPILTLFHSVENVSCTCIFCLVASRLVKRLLTFE